MIPYAATGLRELSLLVHIAASNTHASDHEYPGSSAAANGLGLDLLDLLCPAFQS